MPELGSNERGFSLVEVLVATMLMVMVLMALYALFDMSLRVYGIGNSEVETNERARIALERMEREIRNADCDDSGCLNSDSSDEAIFLTILTDPAPPDSSESIPVNASYYVCDGVIYGCGSGNKGNLMRTQDGVSEALAKLGGEGSLEIDYLDSDCLSAPDTCPDSPELSTTMVEITLEVEDDGRTQTLNSVAGLRNYKETS